MATGAQTWSTSAASNNSADGSVNWAEGMAPSAVNNSARAEMASAAMWIGDNSGVLLTSGTTAAYTVTSKQVSSAVADGYTIAVRLHAANEVNATLNVDGIGAKAMQKYAGTNVALNDLVAGSIHRFTYHTSSTAWVAHGQRNATSLSSLDVTGAAVIAGAATLSSSLTVANATLLSSALTVTGKLTALSSAEITGATLFSSGITAVSIAGSVVATQSDQETGTSVATVVSPGTQHYHPSAAKAWAHFVADGTISASYNVTGVVKDSVGDWTVTIATDFSTAKYAVLATALDSANARIMTVRTQAAGSFTLKCMTDGGSDADPDAIYFVCFGDQ